MQYEKNAPVKEKFARAHWRPVTYEVETRLNRAKYRANSIFEILSDFPFGRDVFEKINS